ncbi:MAG: methylmalonyl-CoA mutase family protein, partial [Phycisphaerales bacterium]
RDGDAVARSLDAIRAACRQGENAMPSLVDGAEAGCTLGEMVQAMADVYGRYSGGPEW